jgi:hypothetical protein
MLLTKARRLLWILLARALRRRPTLVDAAARFPRVFAIAASPHNELLAVEVRRPDLTLSPVDLSRIRANRVREACSAVLVTHNPTVDCIKGVVVCPTCNSIRPLGRDRVLTIFPAATSEAHTNTDYRTVCIYTGKSGNYYHAHSSKINRLVLANGIASFGFMGTNWFHFINEILPRAVLGSQTVEDKSLRVVVAERTFDASRLEILRRLVKNPISIVPYGWEVEFDTLYQHSGMMSIPTRRLSRNNMLGDLTVSVDAIDEMRECLLQEFYKAIDARSMPQRLALARRRYTGGRAINTAVLHEFFDKQGYTRVYLEDFTFEEQVTLMARAKSIVGVTGAAWSLVWLASDLQDAILIAPNPKFLPFQVLASLVSDNVHITPIGEVSVEAAAEFSRSMWP